MNRSRQVFEEFAAEYDRWFDEHPGIYEAQLLQLGKAVPQAGRGLDLGTGSGRFAAPLGIGCGIDPSRPLLAMAKARGTEVVQGEGEHLPFRTGSFDYVLMMTVICFLEDPVAVLEEICRVLAPGGTLVAGFLEKDREIARQYGMEKAGGRFLRSARFRTREEVAGFMEAAGFTGVSITAGSRRFCIMAGSRPGNRGTGK